MDLLWQIPLKFENCFFTERRTILTLQHVMILTCLVSSNKCRHVLLLKDDNSNLISLTGHL